LAVAAVAAEALLLDEHGFAVGGILGLRGKPENYP
jgi:hypothetical protein